MGKTFAYRRQLLLVPTLFVLGWGVGCSLLVTRPVQEMSDTAAALRAAREVQADTLAPELYRQANEWYFRARKEYKFKNFKFAKDYAQKARRFAEQAEFEALRNGGNRSDLPPDPSQAGGPPPPGGGGPAPVATHSPYPYPTQSGHYASEPDPPAYTPPPAPDNAPFTSAVPGLPSNNGAGAGGGAAIPAPQANPTGSAPAPTTNK